jgi:hypothetical protein
VQSKNNGVHMKNLITVLGIILISFVLPAAASEAKKILIKINKDNIADKRDVIIDDRIVSTMFLPSAALVAKEMLILLDKSGKPKKSK